MADIEGPAGPGRDPATAFAVSKRAMRWAGVAVALVLVAVGAFVVGRGTFGGGSHKVKLVSGSQASALPTSGSTTVPSSTTTTVPATTTTAVAATTTTTVVQVSPTQLITSFYADLNTRAFAQAWALQDTAFQAKLGGFSSWEAGYAGTANDQLTVVGATGDEVDISLTATQSDGGQQDYQGVYFVHDGLIAGADVAEVASTPGPWCSVSVDPSYSGWGDIDVNVTSNQPSSSISITTAEAGATDTLTSATDVYGDATALYPAAGSWAQGYPVTVSIEAGAATCGTSFTP